jgi:hypothetical protein
MLLADWAKPGTGSWATPFSQKPGLPITPALIENPQPCQALWLVS